MTPEKSEHYHEIWKIQSEAVLRNPPPSIDARKKSLLKLQNLITENSDAILGAIYKDMGRHPMESFGSEITMPLEEIRAHLKMLKKFSAEKKIAGNLLNWPGKLAEQRVPKGQILILGPWNYPFYLNISPLIGALAGGNRIIVKPSETASSSSQLLCELINKYFDPAEVYAVSGNAETAKDLLKLKWDQVFFTGGTQIGKSVLKQCAETFSPCFLELGGNNPLVIGKEHISKAQVKRMIWGKFFNAGQTCIAPNHFFIPHDREAEIIALWKETIQSFYLKEPADRHSLAQAASQNQIHHLNSLVQKGIAQGAEIIAEFPVKKDAPNSNPRIIKITNPENPLLKEENFGPLMPYYCYKDEDELLRLIAVNDGALAIYGFSISRSLQAKMESLNCYASVVYDDIMGKLGNPIAPLATVGNSGNGIYRGARNIDAFTRIRTIHRRSRWLDWPVIYPPYRTPLKQVKNIIGLFYRNFIC